MTRIASVLALAALVAGMVDAAAPGSHTATAPGVAGAFATPAAGDALPGPTAGDAALEPARAPEAPLLEAAPARASFSVLVDDLEVGLKVMALAVLPGQTVRITGHSSDSGIVTRAGAGGLERGPDGEWLWTAPSAGFHAVEVGSPAARDVIRLTFMVTRPATEVRDGALDGYTIGDYRPRPVSMSASYDPPSGFVEVTEETGDLLVSPNFRLSQFLCKQPGDPRFLVVSPQLLMKLESLLEAVNAAGHPVAGLTVMSGFRTPAYNRAIGNTTDFSRHLWGDAADVYVDANGDGNMDDLNGDGRTDLGDARWLADLMEQVMAEAGPGLVPGGLSAYRPNAVRGPFVHVDARGHPARW